MTRLTMMKKFEEHMLETVGRAGQGAIMTWGDAAGVIAVWNTDGSIVSRTLDKSHDLFYNDSVGDLLDLVPKMHFFDAHHNETNFYYHVSRVPVERSLIHEADVFLKSIRLANRL